MKREQANGKTQQETQTMDTGRLALLDTISLKSGSHRSFEDGVCVMEAAAYVAGEAHSDHPACVSGVIGVFMRSWNDSLRTDEDRDRLLKPLVLTIIGTRSTAEDDRVRAWMAMDWLVREYLPTWLELAGGGLEAHAAALRALPEIADAAALSHASPVILAARAAAMDAIAASPAVMAAMDAIAASSAVMAAMAARDAMDARAARDALAAARAARAAIAAAMAAIAAMARLAPTVALLQESAVALVERMAAVGRVLDQGEES